MAQTVVFHAFHGLKTVALLLCHIRGRTFYTRINIIYIPRSEFEEQLIKIPKDKPVILADNVGVAGKEIALFLLEQGYTQVACLNGGIIDWTRDNMPLKTDRSYILTGQCACQLRPKKLSS